MTQTTLRSARITALEADAAPLDGLLNEYRDFGARPEALNNRIEAACRAQRFPSLIEVDAAILAAAARLPRRGDTVNLPLAERAALSF